MEEKARILIVDDNDNLCTAMSFVLSRKGYSVATANDGMEAIELVRESPFDLILLDIKLPVMDGIETYKRIKQIRPEVVAIMMTAYTVEELVQDALNEGAFAIIYKPLDIEQAISLIEDALETKTGAFILLVDDDSSLGSALKSVLVRKGYRVAISETGENAIEWARGNSFDIILIDMKLPALNGLETYLAIKRIRPEAAAIMTTGYRQEMDELVDEAIRNSAYTCLYKPLDMENLLGLITEILEKSKSPFDRLRG